MSPPRCRESFAGLENVRNSIAAAADGCGMTKQMASAQLALGLEPQAKCLWGGKRAGAGRKAMTSPSRSVPHAVRAAHAARFPIHVTLRARGDVQPLDLRTEVVLRALYRCIVRATQRGRQIVHFSLQTNHLHLIIEAGDRNDVTETVRGFASITARVFNRCLDRIGAFWQDRYHRHDLRTPTEIRNAIAYVLHNRRKHLAQMGTRDDGGLDAFSSAAWFDGWDERGAAAASWLQRALEQRGFTSCVAIPRTFLLAVGWMRVGRIAFDWVAPRAGRR